MWKVWTSLQDSCKTQGVGQGRGSQGHFSAKVPFGSHFLLTISLFGPINPEVDSDCPWFPPQEFLKASRDRLDSPVADTACSSNNSVSVSRWAVSTAWALACCPVAQPSSLHPPPPPFLSVSPIPVQSFVSLVPAIPYSHDLTLPPSDLLRYFFPNQRLFPPWEKFLI